MSANRRPDGTFGEGNRANTGGSNSAFSRNVRGLLKGLVPDAVKVLKGALDGTLEGVKPGEQIQAAKIVVEYTIAKPKAALKVSGSIENPLAGLSIEDIQRLAQGGDK